MQKIWTSLLLLCCTLTLSAQQEYPEFALNRGNGLLPGISYGIHLPGGDLDERFGSHFSVGGSFDFVTSKNSWLLGVQYNLYFGNNVEENPLTNLVNDEGFIIANDRTYADIRLRMRGFYAGAHIGKIISLGFQNPRSGIRVTAGAGLFQHKIRIQNDPLRTVNQLTGEYEKGYDRLTNGLAFTEFVGYQVLSLNKLINFYAGFEFTQAFTQSRRAFNFDTRMQDTTERLDLDFGFRVGWVLPFYVGSRASEEIYY